MTDPTNPAPPAEELRELLAKAGFTRLNADEIGEDPEGVQDAGWRIHDFPDEPNKQGVPMAYWLAGGLDEWQAKLIVAAVNALPTLLDHLSVLTVENERMREAVEQFAVSLESGGCDYTKHAVDQPMCCSGQDCGCQGSSVGQYLAWQLRQASSLPAMKGEG